MVTIPTKCPECGQGIPPPITDWYISMNWEDGAEWPPFVTTVRADGLSMAIDRAKDEMADKAARFRCDETWPAARILEVFGSYWQNVDAFRIDTFVAKHTPPPKAESKLATLRAVQQRLEMIDDLLLPVNLVGEPTTTIDMTRFSIRDCMKIVREALEKI